MDSSGQPTHSPVPRGPFSLFLTCPSVPQSEMAAIGSRVQAQLEERLQNLDDYVRGFQNLVGSPCYGSTEGTSGLRPQISGPGMRGWRGPPCSIPTDLALVSLPRYSQWAPWTLQQSVYCR